MGMIQSILSVPSPELEALRTSHNRAFGLMRKGDLNRAMALYKETLEGEITILGIKHPDTFTTRHNIALLHFRMGEFLEAETLLIELKGLSITVFGAEDPLTFNILESLAATMYVIGKREQAMVTMELVMEGRKRLLGPDYKHTTQEYWVHQLTALNAKFGEYSENPENDEKGENPEITERNEN